MRISFTSFRVAIAFCWIAAVSTLARAQAEPLDVNDVSILWPAPKTAGDVDKLITAAELLADGKSSLFPEDVLRRLLDTAVNTPVEGTGRRIEFLGLANRHTQRSTWKLAGIRVDPSAPGGASHLVALLGSMPQVRLIFQPVTLENGNPRVHDITAHLVFNFGKLTNMKSEPDRAAFGDVVSDLRDLKTSLASAGVSTKGPLNVHPGFGEKTRDSFTDGVKKMLIRRLSSERVGSTAVMGLAPAPEPWIFLSLQRTDKGFVPFKNKMIAGQVAEMFEFTGDVTPMPTTTNIDGKRGVSTSLLFDRDIAKKLKSPGVAGLPRPTLEDIPDLIANPARSHFFNTDCFSCHSETTRRNALKLEVADAMFRFAKQGHVAPALLSDDFWNLRNFGWFGDQATATHRTANEAVESAELINREYGPKE